MDFGTQFAILIIWAIFSAIATKANKDVGKIMWVIEIGIFSVFAVLDILDALNILDFVNS
jgi:hypothetical protein